MADIGDKLRSAREAKGLSIEDIEKATKIQGRYLTAIEQNDFDKLPGDFYVRAFIRQYAQIVGLDGKKLLTEYHQEIPQAEPEEFVEDSIDNKSEEVSKTTSSKKKLWQNYLPRIIVGLGIIVVILVCYVVYAHFSSSKNQDNNSANDVAVSESTTQHKKAKKSDDDNVKIKELGSNQFQVTGLKDNRNLVIRAGSQATTVSVLLDGVNKSSQTLAAEQKHTLNIPETTQTVVVTFSNALGTSILVGDKKVPYNAQNPSLSVTLYIGKRNKQPDRSHQKQGRSVNNYNGHNYYNNQNQGNYRSNNHGSGSTPNRSNGQNKRNNGQTGHMNNHGNGNQNNHSGNSGTENSGSKK